MIFAVFCGGFSSEYEISMLSAQTIVEHFPKEFECYLLEVKQDNWYIHFQGQKCEVNTWNFTFDYQSISYKIDAGIVYIHGNPGENGKLQAYFDMRSFPYINSGSLASELSFDKWYCNQFVKNFGISVAKSLLITSENEYSLDEIISFVALPCFVKPTDSGSSFGISKVNEKSDLKPALKKAFQEGKSVVIESFLNGREITCGVYKTKKGLKTLPLTEIVSENEFFDYEAKYLGKSKEITPAPISKQYAELIEEKAILIYKLLQLKSIARIDFMLVDDQVFLIEVNTTPGFSPASIVPQMIRESGQSIEQFWRDIILEELKLN